MLTTFLLVECHWGRPPGILFSSVILWVWVAASLLSSSFQNADQERHNLPCPVRALDAYVHRAALWRNSFFVCFGPPNKGFPASKQRMSKWVVEAISLAYDSAGQTSPMAVRSHSTRSMAASKALISGVALQEVCDAAGWSSPHTFVRFYSLDLDSTPGSQVLLS